MLGYVWVAIEPVNKVIIVGIRISFERNMLIAEQFLKGLVKKYGKHSSTFYRWWNLVSILKLVTF
jgi:transposase-like protein